MNKAAFLDRDGVINRKAKEGQYVTSWEEMQILPGVTDATALLNRAGFLVIVVSNQRCVAKHLISAKELDVLHDRMRAHFAEHGAEINAVYYCPHDTSPTCACRKPAPGMIFEAAHSFDIDLASSWMIGDSAIDVEAGKRAGCKTARLTELGATNSVHASQCNITANSLLDAVTQILRCDQDSKTE